MLVVLGVGARRRAGRHGLSSDLSSLSINSNLSSDLLPVADLCAIASRMAAAGTSRSSCAVLPRQKKAEEATRRR